MSADLILPLRRPVPFAELLRTTEETLLTLLRMKSVPSVLSKLPPRPSSSRDLEGSRLDAHFPGAYLSFEGDPSSTVSLDVFQGGRGGKELLVGIGSVPAASSQVLAAAVAAAAAGLMGDVKIGDYAHNWVERDECSAEELVRAIGAPEQHAEFKEAVELVHTNQAIKRGAR